MDKPNKLNERLTLFANLAVVVGIVFLALEMRQNTGMMQAQIRDSLTEKQMSIPRRARWRSSLNNLGVRQVWELLREQFAPNFRSEVDAIVAEIEK